MKKKGPSDKVGYCRPPKHSQFKKGQSGNPKGRPRRSTTLRAIALEELERIVHPKNGQPGKGLELKQAIVRAHGFAAANGNVRSAEFILKLLGDNDNETIEAADEVPQLPDDDQKILDDYVARQQKLKSGGDNE